MAVVKEASLPIQAGEDVVTVRNAVRAWAIEVGCRLVEQTKLVTAASEIARNALKYGGGGNMILQVVEHEHRRALRLHFEDHGPGIADLDEALQDGFSTGGGLGLGLGGARRLVHEFEIQSRPGVGTTVTLTQWITGYSSAPRSIRTDRHDSAGRAP